MNYKIITLFVLSFIIVSSITFDEAFAHPQAPAVGVAPTVILEQKEYYQNDSIKIICVPEHAQFVKSIAWIIQSEVLDKRIKTTHQPAEYSFSLDTVGEYEIKCRTNYGDSHTTSNDWLKFSILPFVFPYTTIPVTGLVDVPDHRYQAPFNSDTFANNNNSDTKKNGSSCPDCVPPTIGTDSQGKRFVDYGVVLNGEKFQMGNYKTHIPMMFTEIGQENHVELKVYENWGAYNIDMIQFAIVKEIGSSMDFEPRFQIDVKNTANDIHNPALEGVELIDKKGIIDNYSVEPSLVYCMEGFTHTCLQLDIYWTFAQVPEFKVLAINGWDNGKSSFSHFLNDGLTVIDPTPIIPEPEEIPKEKECIIYKVAKRINSCQFQPMIDSAIQRAEETMKMIMK